MTGMNEQEKHLLAPTGRLRVGIAVGPAISAVWAMRDEKTGQPHGVTVDLGAAIAKRLAIPVDYVEFGSSGKIIEAAAEGRWDIAFTPVDAERKKVVAFGPNYFLGESTYMVPAQSPIATIADVDKPSVQVVGVENTATIRSARKSVRQAQVIGVGDLEEAATMFADGRASAIALGRESLLSLAPRFPGARILDGHFRHGGCSRCAGRLNELSCASHVRFRTRK
jgi:polar amino acid transport system substrate-binding protein